VKNPLATVRRIARGARAGRPAGVVLLYHRVADLDSDPQRLAITPSRFAQHLELLTRCYRPLPLKELATRARAGTLPDRAVAVTFDDGYADLIENAKPLLDRFDVHATLFVTTSLLGSTREFWWDDLERLLLTPGNLPSALTVAIGERTRTWDLDEGSSYTAGQRRMHAAWDVESSANPTTRHDVYRQLHRLMRDASAAEREQALGALAAARSATSTGRQTHRVLSQDEVVRLAKDPLVAIGAHTVNHPMLSALPSADQRSEIVESRTTLQRLTDREIGDFAYPFGGSDDYTHETETLVREAGFTAAYGTTPGAVGPRSDPFALPRIGVSRLDADQLDWTLHEWM